MGEIRDWAQRPRAATRCDCASPVPRSHRPQRTWGRGRAGAPWWGARCSQRETPREADQAMLSWDAVMGSLLRSKETSKANRETWQMPSGVRHSSLW